MRANLSLLLATILPFSLSVPLQRNEPLSPRQRVHKIDPVAVYETVVTCTLVVKPVRRPSKIPASIELNGVIGRTLAFGSHSGMINSGSITTVEGPSWWKGEYTVTEIISAVNSTAEETAAVMTSWARKARLPGAFSGTDWNVRSVTCQPEPLVSPSGEYE
ncbi:hypothetical protein DFP72DRAFT_511555 [Ephemerocybe angulata]|uniref:Uncharacterized protein n=1 Tax=Ephemerocybe angulata TaxID=980116 RepID=A0A8H6M288_9AGAR|nr:hypothetical protein DFP72DRAFT_511555 [Tulosesus angulatus]